MVQAYSLKNTIIRQAILAPCLVACTFAAPSVVALEKQQAVKTGADQRGRDVAPEFHYLDTDGNEALDWREIATVYREELAQINWSKEQAMSAYDSDQNNQLNPQEYREFMNGLINEIGGAGSASSEAQQPSSKASRASTMTARGQFGTQSSRPMALENTGEAVTVRPEVLEGQTVVNLQAEPIGEVRQVLVSEHGQVSGLVVMLRDLPTVAEKTVFVSVAEIEPTGEMVIWRTNMNEQELQGLPDFDSEAVSTSTY